MQGGCIRMFISWLNLILRKTIFRSYKTLLAVLRLFRRCQVVSNGKERDFRDRGLVALSSQPTELNTSKIVTLAVQSEDTEPVDEGSNVTTFSAQPSQNLIASLISMPVPHNYPPLPQPATPGRSAIRLIPIIPAEIQRYDRDVPIKDKNLVFKVEKGPLDCLEDVPIKDKNLVFNVEKGPLDCSEEDAPRVFTDADVRDREIANKVGGATDMRVFTDADVRHPGDDDNDGKVANAMTVWITIPLFYPLSSVLPIYNPPYFRNLEANSHSPHVELNAHQVPASQTFFPVRTRPPFHAISSD
ncbi:hypothetical protein AZE42_03882 [Rhizopogon vesiculosus]|uniref:Uncharacterized protein n=1 Tax=Rhizopogon vesiculosus TaxID=180088 RepID=A0A1J8QKX6_9AGAM|nr:hypothetical protein AZE42_03882 [Rhizopogon vesiculosus]